MSQIRLSTLGGVCLLVATMALAATPPAAGQGPGPSPRSALSAADSADLLETARDAQSEFERQRIRYLPWARGYGGGGWVCDERVGRMCWRHDDPEDDWTTPPEDERLTSAREELLATLTSVLTDVPGDRWVLGQWAWYTGEAGRWDDVVARMESCPASATGWCAALSGLALHHMQQYERAAAAFVRAQVALAEPGPEAEWELRVLLDGEGRDLMDEEDGEGVATTAPPGALAGRTQPAEALTPLERLWLLADPMYIVPGNDRWTAHQARRVVNRLRDRARNPYRMSWGPDLSQLVMRYGWAVSWERVRVRTAGLDDRSIIGHHEPKGRGFIVPGALLSDASDVTPEDGEAVAERPRTTYRPGYTPVIRPGNAAVYPFDRGDSTWVVGVFAEPAPDTVSTEQGTFAADLTTGVQRAGEALGDRSWRIRLPLGPHVVSVERLGDSATDARRYRTVIDRGRRPEAVVALSDLIRLDDAGEPASFEAMAQRIQVGPAQRGAPFVLAWEAYGLGFDSSPQAYRLSIRREEGGILSRLAGWAGLGDGNEPTILAWSEPQPEDPGPALRSVRVDLPPLEPGRYVLQLDLTLQGRAPVRSERTIEFRDSR